MFFTQVHRSNCSLSICTVMKGCSSKLIYTHTNQSVFELWPVTERDRNTFLYSNSLLFGANSLVWHFFLLLLSFCYNSNQHAFLPLLHCVLLVWKRYRLHRTIEQYGK